MIHQFTMIQLGATPEVAALEQLSPASTKSRSKTPQTFAQSPAPLLHRRLSHRTPLLQWRRQRNRHNAQSLAPPPSGDAHLPRLARRCTQIPTTRNPLSPRQISTSTRTRGSLTFGPIHQLSRLGQDPAKSRPNRGCILEAEPPSPCVRRHFPFVFSDIPFNLSSPFTQPQAEGG